MITIWPNTESGLRAGLNRSPLCLNLYVLRSFLAFSSTFSEARPSRAFISRLSAMLRCLAISPFRKQVAIRPPTAHNYLSGRNDLFVRHRGAANLAAGSIRERTLEVRRVVSGRPSGCPRSFCGCGAALRVFGRVVPELNLAANWLRFPRTSPAPGMVAARHGHVFVLEQHVEGDTWMAYDANSGGHATRIHARSLRGYTSGKSTRGVTATCKSGQRGLTRRRLR